MPQRNWLSDQSLKQLFDRALGVVFSIILLFTILTFVIGVVRLFFRVGDLMQFQGVTGGYLYVFSDVLTLFVLAELSRSLVDYFTEHRLRLTFVLDAGIVFVLRDLMIGLFEHKLGSEDIYALSTALLVLGIIRTAAAVVYQRSSRTIREPPGS